MEAGELILSGAEKACVLGDRRRSRCPLLASHMCCHNAQYISPRLFPIPCTVAAYLALVLGQLHVDEVLVQYSVCGEVGAWLPTRGLSSHCALTTKALAERGTREATRTPAPLMADRLHNISITVDKLGHIACQQSL